MATKKKEKSPESLETVERKPEEQTSAAPEVVEAAPADQTPPENAPGVKTETPSEPPETPEPEKEVPALETVKPTAVASGSEQIAETAGAGELASPRMDPPLERLEVLADRHRVPTWQQSALCRFMGWEDGKMVANAEYLDALDKLKTRRVGGGRMG